MPLSLCSTGAGASSEGEILFNTQLVKPDGPSLPMQERLCGCVPGREAIVRIQENSGNQEADQCANAESGRPLHGVWNSMVSETRVIGFQPGNINADVCFTEVQLGSGGSGFNACG